MLIYLSERGVLMKRQNLRGKRKINIWISASMGALCLVVLFALLMPMLGATLAADSGVKQYSRSFDIPKDTEIKNAENADTIWFLDGDSFDTIKFKKDMFAKQRVTGTARITDGGTTQNKSIDENFVIDFSNTKAYSKDAKFSLDMSTSIECSTDVDDVVGLDNAFHRIWWESDYTTTLYSVVRDTSSSNNSFVNFETDFQNYCKKKGVIVGVSRSEKVDYFLREPRKSNQDLDPILLKDALIGYVESIIADNSIEVYKNKADIPLDGVKRIDMITCSWKRFDFYDNYNSYYRDYEFLIYQTHSYVFPGCGTKLDASDVIITTESGRSISDNIIAEDSLILSISKGNGVLQLNENCSIQYKLSDSPLFVSGISEWNVYNGPIPLDGTNYSYIYYKLVPINDGTKKLLGSDVSFANWNYLTTKATFVTANVSKVDKGDEIILSASDGSGLILYSRDADAVWKKISKSDVLNGLTELKSKDEKISCWKDLSGNVYYIRVNNLLYKSEKPYNLYEDAIIVGDEIYDGNMSLYSIHLEDTCVVDEPNKLDFSLEFKNVTEQPVLTTEKGKKSLKIGESIYLSSKEDTEVFYTLNGRTPTVKVNNTGNKLEPADTNTIAYTDSGISVSIENSFNYGGSVNIRAVAFCYENIGGTLKQTKKNSEVLKWTSSIDYPMLPTPSAGTESGKSLVESGIKLFRDDTLRLTLDTSSFNNVYGTEFGALADSSYTLKYKLSTNPLNPDEISGWSTYTKGSSISLKGGQKYLYIKAIPNDNVKASDSAVASYSWDYYSEEPSSVSSIGDDTVIDVGSVVELKGDSRGGIIIYTLDGSYPVLKKASTNPGTNNLHIKDNISYISETDNKISYVKVNDLWYECSTSGDANGSVYLYTDAIKVGKEIYTKGYLDIWAQCIVNGYVIGSPNRISFAHELTYKVVAPVIFTSDGKESIKMGESVSVSCETSNTKIFYTLNGSAPSIVVDGTQLKAGNNTYLYTGSIVMSENIVDYGQRVTVIAQAVSYEEVDGKLVRNMKDSSLSKKTYLIDNQSAIEKVTSIPTTTSESPTVVMAGSKIYLSCPTDGTSIFYTLDGTEPSFNKSTLEVVGTSTYKYNASNGVTVPEAKDSTLLTLTAVAYNGLASSEIASLIFQYPEAVSSPYVTPGEGSVTENTEVVLKTASENAIIYYEIAYEDAKPNTPTAEKSMVFDASSPIKITRKTTISAIAVRDNMKSAVSTFVYTVADKLKTPEPSISSGSIISNGTMISLKADKGATIRYTMDGSDPSDMENKAVLVGENVLIQGDAGSVVTLKVYATKTNYSDSDVGYYLYSISSYGGGIYADKEDGSTVKNGEVIHLNTDVSSASIYYTVDGSAPSESSTKGSSVTISGSPGENVVVSAIAVSSGTEKSISFATFTYTIMNRLAAPTASVPDGAVFTKVGYVSLTSESGKIYYTIDGSEPSTASNLYRGAIEIQESLQIKAIAVDDGYESSEVRSFSYAFASQVETPQASYASGELEMGTEISFSCATEGASLYYRTDGIEPDPSNKNGIELYTGPIVVDRATTFKVIAVKDRMQNSKVVTVAYTVREPIIEEVVEEEESQITSNNTDRLQSRRSFSDAETGPSYTDVVLKNATYGAVVSADEGVLPDNVQLKVEQTQNNTAAEHSIKQIVSENYGIVASYDISLLVNGEKTQPDGTVEIGIPIPAKYENSLIQIVYIADDGAIELYDTRRSRGVAYAKVEHFSVYALAAPVDYVEKEENFPWKTVIYFTTIAFVGVGGFLLNRARKMKKEGEE